MAEIKVPVVKARGYKRIEHQAIEFLKKADSGALTGIKPVPILEFFDSPVLKKLYGFKSDVKELTPSLMAYTDFGIKSLVLSENTYRQAYNNVPRARFTIGHEIGHVVLHAQELSGLHEEYATTVLARSVLRAFEDPEWQADVFSSAVLMPYGRFVKLINGGATVNDIIDHFEVSYTAACRRLGNVNKMLKKTDSPELEFTDEDIF